MVGTNQVGLVGVRWTRGDPLNRVTIRLGAEDRNASTVRLEVNEDAHVKGNTRIPCLRNCASRRKSYGVIVNRLINPEPYLQRPFFTLLVGKW